MHKLKKYWEKVSADPVKIEEMEEIVCEALEEIRGRCPRLFWDTAYKLHCVAYGPHVLLLSYKNKRASLQNR